MSKRMKIVLLVTLVLSVVTLALFPTVSLLLDLNISERTVDIVMGIGLVSSLFTGVMWLHYVAVDTDEKLVALDQQDRLRLFALDVAIDLIDNSAVGLLREEDEKNQARQILDEMRANLNLRIAGREAVVNKAMARIETRIEKAEQRELSKKTS